VTAPGIQEQLESSILGQIFLVDIRPQVCLLEDGANSPLLGLTASFRPGVELHRARAIDYDPAKHSYWEIANGFVAACVAAAVFGVIATVGPRLLCRPHELLASKHLYRHIVRKTSPLAAAQRVIIQWMNESVAEGIVVGKPEAMRDEVLPVVVWYRSFAHWLQERKMAAANARSPGVIARWARGSKRKSLKFLVGARTM
jgi:hypothetical protein